MKIFKFILLLIPILCYSQKGFKPGKIDPAAVAMETCPYDSSAGAFYIFNYGETGINSQLEVEFRHIVQIKIVDKSELDRGDITIPHSIKSGVVGLKAYTYNIEDGELVTTKLEKSSIFKEKVNDTRANLKFSMPNVKEGSVIEYSYRVNYGNYRSLNTWYFQTSIPVLKSEYHVRIPEYFDYSRNMTGYIGLQKADIQNENGQFGSARVINKHHHYVAMNVPAFDSEKYVRSRNDVISKIGFQLRSLTVPGSVYDNYLYPSFGALANKLMENTYWSNEIAKASWASDALATLTTAATEKENAEKIFDYIKNFDKKDASSNTLRGVFKNKAGTDWELNRTLIAVLREAGFNVDPVLIRTRSRGRLDVYNPMRAHFNFIIAKVTIDDKIYLLDASEKENVFGVLPRYCLNERGLVVKKGAEEWVKLNPYRSSQKIVQSKLELSPDGLLSGTIQVRRKGYNAWDFEEDLEEDGEEDYIESFEKEKENWTIDSHSFESNPKTYIIDEMIEAELENQVEDLGNVLYLNPMIYGTWSENPFKGTERIYPVDFGVPFTDMIITEIELPDGFEIESLPERVSLAMPNNAAMLTYSASAVGNKISINQRISIKQLEYLPDDYSILREFFARIVEKSGEQIVLKRI